MLIKHLITSHGIWCLLLKDAGKISVISFIRGRMVYAGQTKFSILHAGGRSLFRFQTIRETRMAICSSSRLPEPHPLIRALERVRPKPVYLLYWI